MVKQISQEQYEKNQKEMVDYITKVFSEWNMSGIISIPKVGVISLYKNNEDKSKILEQAGIELQADLMFKEMKARDYATEQYRVTIPKNSNKNPRSYHQ